MIRLIGRALTRLRRREKELARDDWVRQMALEVSAQTVQKTRKQLAILRRLEAEVELERHT